MVSICYSTAVKIVSHMSPVYQRRFFFIPLCKCWGREQSCYAQPRNRYFWAKVLCHTNEQGPSVSVFSFCSLWWDCIVTLERPRSRTLFFSHFYNHCTASLWKYMWGSPIEFLIGMMGRFYPLPIVVSVAYNRERRDQNTSEECIAVIRIQSTNNDVS